MGLSKGRVTTGNMMDSVAIGVSFACLVHCLALPLIIALLPAWSAWLDVPEAFHVWILVFAAPFSLTVLLRAARGRLWFAPLWLGIAGLVAMGLALLAGNTTMETVVTTIGGILLASAHLMNWRRRVHATH